MWANSLLDGIIPPFHKKGARQIFAIKINLTCFCNINQMVIFYDGINLLQKGGIFPYLRRKYGTSDVLRVKTAVFQLKKILCVAVLKSVAEIMGLKRHAKRAIVTCICRL